jgi:hypothetical protein
MRACSVSGQDSHIPLDRRTFLQWLSRWWRGQHESGSPSFSIISCSMNSTRSSSAVGIALFAMRMIVTFTSAVNARASG